ncbi:MAG: gamma-glutamyltransferase [Myxococcota bacterium]
MTTTRAPVRSFGGTVAAGHYLATQIGAQMLASGGNAADAACAMGAALWVLEPTQNGPGGEVPILVRDPREDRVVVISGQGPAPAAATIEHFEQLGLSLIPPDGLLSAAIPGALDAWCQLLERYGTRRLSEVFAPARALAERGFPMYPFLRVLLELIAPRFEREWPSSAAIYTPVPPIGGRQTNPAMAAWLKRLCDADRQASGREAGIRAARAVFYEGPDAEAIERFLTQPVKDASGEAHAGLLTAHDLATYTGACEEPAHLASRGSRVWKAGAWSQGPVFLQQLALLGATPLGDLSTADALHRWIEVAKLAFADRDACYGDPAFVKVPLDRLLSAEYAAERARRIDPKQASRELVPGMGRLPKGWPLGAAAPQAPVEPGALAASRGRTDTTMCVASDASGLVIAATPSGGWIPTSPVVPELGFPVGTRLQMAVLDPEHPNALAPGKRPRTTLSPSLAELPDGRWLAFGTPGGDQQDQWTSQFFLRVLDQIARGENDLQAAIDAPTVHSDHMPSSFYPRHAKPAAISAETRFADGVLEDLEGRGHDVLRAGPWAHGRVLAASHDPATGVQEAAASPRFAVADAIAVP